MKYYLDLLLLDNIGQVCPNFQINNMLTSYEVSLSNKAKFVGLARVILKVTSSNAKKILL